MRRRRTTQDERYPSVADLLPSWERLSEEPKKKLLTIRRGEGGEERRGGPLRSPASWSVCSRAGKASTPPPPGDHKGPPFPTSSALAPTDHPASCLASRLRLMPITADLSAFAGCSAI